MVGWSVRALTPLLIVFSTAACYHTEPFYAARGEAGRTAFGFARHDFTFSNTAVWGAAQAAAVAESGGNDSVWRLHEGGRKLHFCQHGSDVASCAPALFVDEGEPDLGMGIMMLMVDPLNQGSYALEQPYSNADGSTTVNTWGLVYISDWDLPLVPDRGVWLTTTEQPCALGMAAPLYYCRLEQGRPICHAVKLGGEKAEICGIAGVHVLGTADVLWFHDTDDVYRCAVHGGMPEPVCQKAQQRGPGPAPPVAAVPVPPKSELAPAEPEPAPEPPAPSSTETPPAESAPPPPAEAPTAKPEPEPAKPEPAPPAPPAAKGAVGAACAKADDCEAGLRCIASSCTSARSDHD